MLSKRSQRLILKRFIYTFLAAFLTAYPAFAQTPKISLKKNGRFVEVRQGRKMLYRVALKNGVLVDENYSMRNGKSDEAFLVGKCLIVRRNVFPGEIFPEVLQLETYQLSGKKAVYRHSKLGIQTLGGGRIFTSPDSTWAVVPIEEEAFITGYFHILQNCRIREVAFPFEPTFGWSNEPDGRFEARFIDKSTLEFPPVTSESSDGNKKKVKIRIKKDGSYVINDRK